MMHQYATLEDTVYLWFGINDTAGSGADGATPLYDVREGGAASGAAPTLSGTPTLLEHVNFPAGAYEVAVAATAANGFAVNKTYGVFCTLAVDGQNPTGFIGSFRLAPVPASDADWDEGGRLDLLLDAAKENTDYPDGYVYIDSSAGTAGTTVGTHGTPRTPVNDWADAHTIAVARGRQAVRAAPGSAIIISSGSFNNYMIDLNGGVLIIDDAVVITSSQIISSAKTARLYETSVNNKIIIGQACFLDNLFINGLILSHAQSYITNCGFYNNITLPTIHASLTPQFINCYNSKDNGTAVDFNFTNGGEALLQGWYGDLSVSNMGSVSTLVCFGYGKLTIAASCTGGTIKHTSHVEISDLSSGAVTTELISEADKTGYKLASDGLDAVSIVAPTGVASNFREMMVAVWRRLFKRVFYDKDAGTIETFADDNATPLTTQNVTSSATEEEVESAS